MNPQYTFKNFLPLIIILSVICVLTVLTLFITGFTAHHAMTYFMGFFLVIFGSFKLMHWSGFVQAYKEYDLVAQRSTTYAYVYPLFELGLGCGYLLQWQVPMLNIITIMLMVVSSLGVTKELLAGREITCACLGTVFKIPMTWVTLLEDLVMAGMAGLMLVW